MNRLIFSFVVFCFAFLTGWAQKNETLLTIGDTKIDKAEFVRIYTKNNKNLLNDSDKKTPSEYLELFIDYKLKVLEAEALQMDTAATFKNELAGYREELAKPYLTDVNFNKEMVNDLYNRMTKEINASHILFAVPQNATEDQINQVRKKAIKVRTEILNGKDFNAAAAEYSEDPSAKSNQGNLGYFTAFQMVAPFEDAAFNTTVGEVSEPVRTSFGFHLIKVNDVRKNRGDLKVAHIMKIFPQNATDSLMIKLKTEIDTIYRALMDGADFAKMATQFSDDKRTAASGGEMPWFSAGRMIPEFAEPAFALQNIGDFTAPVKTNYGYHIIKKLDHRPIKSFEELKDDIEARIKKDPQRSTYSKKAFVEKLKKEYNFREVVENKDKLQNKNVDQKVENSDMTLFNIGGKDYNLNNFQDYLTKQNIQEGSYLSYFEDWIENEITKFEDARLEEKYPEFRYLMQEYHDGILLFNISQEKVWDFASQDSVGLEKYYNKNKNKYSWEERFKGYIVTCNTADDRKEVEKYFSEGIPKNEILDLLNSEKERVIIKEGAWEKGNEPVVDYYVWNGSKPENFNQETTFVRGDIIPPESKILEEARGLYISDYQNYLEKQWIKDLRSKYKIKVNKKLLKTIPGV